MSERCKYCDPDFRKYLWDNVESQELCRDDIDAVGELVYSVYMTPNGIKKFLFDNKGNVISKIVVKVNYCPMCGRELKAEDE